MAGISDTTIEPSFNSVAFSSRLRKWMKILGLVIQDFVVTPFFYIFGCRIIPNRCKYGIYGVVYFGLIAYMVYTLNFVKN